MAEVWFPKKVKVQSTNRNWTRVEKGAGKYKAIDDHNSIRRARIKTLKELVDEFGDVEVVER